MEDALLSGRVKLMPMMMRFAGMALLLLGLVAEANSQAGAVPGAEWRQFATPERAGWSATRLAEILGYVEEMGSTSAMIVQHGVVVAAWGDVNHRSNLHSCRKSLLNALIGIAAAEGTHRRDDFGLTIHHRGDACVGEDFGGASSGRANLRVITPPKDGPFAQIRRISVGGSVAQEGSAGRQSAAPEPAAIAERKEQASAIVVPE